MIIKSIKLTNFQCYHRFEASFSNMTFIKGKNGTGKTSLGLDAILFALFGYSKKNLSEVPRRGESKSCGVRVEIEYKGVNYRIERKYPTHLDVEVGGLKKEFKTSAEGQRFLNSLFGDVKTFQKFRMIDSGVGINFLEEGQVALKKTLFSVSDEVFNRVRDKLNGIKREREIYNKEKAVIYPHFPSESRLDVLDRYGVDLKQKVAEMETEDRKRWSEMSQSNNIKGRAEGELKTAKWQREQIEKNTHCYACKQEILPETKKRMAEEKDKEIKAIENKLKEANEILEEVSEIREMSQPTIKGMKAKYEKIHDLMVKLEGRLKQKEYIYTSKDIEVVKRALKELDNLSTRYLTQSLSILEPIINSVLEKIRFNVRFEVNDKGKLNISLTKEGVKFNYKDLSTGQKLLLQIAFKLALLLERGEEGIIIADEGLSSLDEENLLHVLTIFENFPFQLVFIIHNWNEVPGEVKIIDLNKVRE